MGRGDAMTVASQKAACLDKDHIRDTADLHGVGHFAQVALSHKLVAEMGCLIVDVQP